MHMPARKAVNLTMDAELLAKAKAEGLNLSAELDQRVRTRISTIEEERWKRDNADAIAAWNQELEENGLWSDGLRTF
jgi:antitoxin CcdA